MSNGYGFSGNLEQNKNWRFHFSKIEQAAAKNLLTKLPQEIKETIFYKDKFSTFNYIIERKRHYPVVK
jgi:hypothetical protein